ncbi:MAG: Holliday junction resolvase RuvX [Pseudomonadota bacterium]
MPERPSPTTLLAFDFGKRRIGVAVGQTVTGSASPLGIVSNRDAGPDHDRIAALIEEWLPGRLIVGLPLNADGSDSDIVAAVRAFAVDLERYALPIELVDERLSSHEAEQTLIRARQSGSRGQIRKADIDAAAAVVIAERYLASLA